MSCLRVCCHIRCLSTTRIAILVVGCLALFASSALAQYRDCDRGGLYDNGSYGGGFQGGSGFYGGEFCDGGSCPGDFCGNACQMCGQEPSGVSGPARYGARICSLCRAAHQKCGKKGCGKGCGDGTHCGMPAPSYPVPFATPRNVTHTTFTYPPMMPHHSLPHYAGTYSFRHGPGMSRTNVHWRETKVLNGLAYLHHLIEIPR
jgi:hypothetical protein